MRLLDSEQLELAFQLHRIDHDVLARSLYQRIWDQIKRAERADDRSALGACRQEIRNDCSRYFAVMNNWAADEGSNDEAAATPLQAAANSQEASQLLGRFEKQFVRYALCYLDLNRVMVRARRRIVRLAGDTNIDKLEAPAIDHATGTLLFRLHRERSEIAAKRTRLNEAQAVLRSMDPLLEDLGASLPKRLGPGRGDRELTSFKAAVRHKDFVGASRLATAWSDRRLEAVGAEIIAIASEHSDLLLAQGLLILHSGETRLISSFLDGDEARINARIERLNIPYMVFQFRALLHHALLLGKIGTLESLIILHAKLLGLVARAPVDTAQAHRDLHAILLPARAIEERFRTLASIFAATEAAEAILEKLFVETERYQSVRPAI